MKKILCILLLVGAFAVCFTNSLNAANKYELDGGGAYFRIDIMTQDQAENKKEKIFIEAYGLNELPQVPELDKYPDIRKDFNNYVKLGFTYIKIEIIYSAKNTILEKKIELFKPKK